MPKTPRHDPVPRAPYGRLLGCFGGARRPFSLAGTLRRGSALERPDPNGATGQQSARSPVEK
jgi:hypothetical protein